VRDTTDADEHRGLRELLGPGALEHLSRSDQKRLRGHLRSCDGCREEYDDLRDVATDLAHADPSWTDREPDAPPGLDDRVVTAVLGQGGGVARPSPVVSGLAAGIVAVLVLALVVVVAGGTGAGSERVEFSAIEGIEVDARLTPRSWGTQVDLEMDGLTDGERYVVLLERRDDGPAVSAGTFHGREDEGVAMTLSGALDRSEIEAVTVATFDGDVVMRAELEEVEPEDADEGEGEQPEEPSEGEEPQEPAEGEGPDESGEGEGPEGEGEGGG
jgi:hypothetical protein